MTIKKAKDLRPGDRLHRYGIVLGVRKNRVFREVTVRVANEQTGRDQRLYLSKNEEMLVEEDLSRDRHERWPG